MVKPKLKQLIRDSEKYVASLQYDNKTSFENYLSYSEMVRDVINDFRDEYAMKHYGVSFKELSGNLREKVQWKYPVNLTTKNVEIPD
jgi:hypothetical protein